MAGRRGKRKDLQKMKALFCNEKQQGGPWAIQGPQIHENLAIHPFTLYTYAHYVHAAVGSIR